MTLQCWHVQKCKTFLCKILRDLKTQTTFPGILFRVTKQLWNGRGWEKFLGQRYIWEVERLGKKLCFERLGEVLGRKKYLGTWEVGRKDIFWEVGRSFREENILRSWEKRYNLSSWEKFWGTIYILRSWEKRYNLRGCKKFWGTLYILRGWEKFPGKIYFITICFKFSLPQIQGIWFNYSAEFEEWAQKSKI